MQKRYSCTFGNSVNVGAESIGVTVTVKLPEAITDAQFVELLRTFRKRRLSGLLVLGADHPQQTNAFDDRTTVEGTFDTGVPSCPEGLLSVRLTFNTQEVDARRFQEILGKDGWLVINSVSEIPQSKATKKQLAEGQEELFKWQQEPPAVLGLGETTANSLAEASIQSIGRLVSILNEEDEEIPSLTGLRNIGEGRIDAIRQKLELYFQQHDIESPLLQSV